MLYQKDLNKGDANYYKKDKSEVQWTVMQDIKKCIAEEK